MKRPLLIAILLFIALSAAPACAIKKRPEPRTDMVKMNRVETNPGSGFISRLSLASEKEGRGFGIFSY
ncbi:MAG TPA: hypothetical protein VNH22_06505 [Blastocatellia bacterium]|jgi:hypothetical protein|nr:hypothetical protein [Blastocatellia bacterium]